VPKWKASTITFKNVYISRRPIDPAEVPDKKRKTAKATPPSPTPFLASTVSPETYLAAPPASETDNYTMFDINIDEVDVTLSFMRWLDGKGLVKDASVKGVRGVVGAYILRSKSIWEQGLTVRSSVSMVGHVKTVATRRFPSRHPSGRFRAGESTH
jgi:distribution and morphology protein 31